ncbi:glycosyltransferase [Marixanthomonas spongiae]|nr:glycosyltransferase [Marixanthomonas spongiae]
MPNKKVLLVFRKAHKGNYSIEKVYHAVYRCLKEDTKSILEYKELTLRRTYDFFQFIRCFFGSLVSKTHIVHITGGCNYMVMAFPFKKRVLTIHDLYHYQQLKGLKGIIYNLFFYRLPIRFSHKIVAVSNETKNQLLRYFNHVNDKITVIHNPLTVPEKEIKTRERIFSKERPVQVLQIGNKPLKNYRRFIEATKSLNLHYHFVHSKTEAIQALIAQHDIHERSNVYSNLGEEQLYGLYHKTDVLYFASEAEGFGLPVIEAQAFGIPVITSKLAPLKNIGTGALFVNPLNISEIKNAFENLYEPGFIKRKIAEGKENSRRYILKKTSNNYSHLYKNL